MPKKPNYDFERRERDRAKAAKQAEKAALKREQREAAAAQMPAAQTQGAAPADPENE